MNVATRGEDNGRKLRKLLRNAERREEMIPLAYLCSSQVRICPYELRRCEDVGRDLNPGGTREKQHPVAEKEEGFNDATR